MDEEKKEVEQPTPDEEPKKEEQQNPDDAEFKQKVLTWLDRNSKDIAEIKAVLDAKRDEVDDEEEYIEF